jgi:hypothetical protein
MPSKAKANTTTDHDEIRRWAEERGATPACVRGTGNKGDIGMLRLDFPGYSGADSLEPITWDEWFEKFDERGLALLHQEATAQGQKSNFNKLVSRETAQARSEGDHKASSKTLRRAVTGGTSKSSGGAKKVAALPKRTGTTKASSTEKSASQSKAQSRNARRSAEEKSAQKHHPITNVSRKQEGSKPSPRAGGRRRAA